MNAVELKIFVSSAFPRDSYYQGCPFFFFITKGVLIIDNQFIKFKLANIYYMIIEGPVPRD